MKLITLYVPEPYLKALDQLINERYYPNRAEAIRVAIRDLLSFEVWKTTPTTSKWSKILNTPSGAVLAVLAAGKIPYKVENGELYVESGYEQPVNIIIKSHKETEEIEEVDKRFVGVKSLLDRMLGDVTKQHPSVNLLMALHKNLGKTLDELHKKGIR